MKLSKTTKSVIKNFSSINPNLMIRQGNVLTTISPSKWIYAEATVDDTFDQDFGIYDLNELLAVISIFEDPDLEFRDQNVLFIKEGKNVVRYLSAESEVLILPKSRIKFPEESDVTFELSQTNMVQISKAASVLKAPFISIVGERGIIRIDVHDKNNPNANRFTIEVGESNHTFCANLKTELLKMVNENYTVDLYGDKKASRFTGVDKLYMLAWETDSIFNK